MDAIEHGPGYMQEVEVLRRVGHANKVIDKHLNEVKAVCLGYRVPIHINDSCMEHAVFEAMRWEGVCYGEDVLYGISGGF